MCIVEFDYQELRGAIKAKFGKETEFAKEIDMSTVTLSSKLNGKTGFTEGEMFLILRKLGIPILEVNKYFFTEKLKKT